MGFLCQGPLTFNRVCVKAWGWWQKSQPIILNTVLQHGFPSPVAVRGSSPKHPIFVCRTALAFGVSRTHTQAPYPVSLKGEGSLERSGWSIESRGPTTEASWARAISQMSRSDSVGQQPSLAPAQMCLVIFCALLILSWKGNMALSFPGSTLVSYPKLPNVLN